ncbi:MAG TPA: serine/threonine-protein kinase [Vicinamibacterales bacterium]|jgi:serine/threonine protein kinase
MTLSDRAVDRLRRLEDRPEFDGGRYELGDEIGRGGMGVVFRAFDRELDRDVAVKVTAWNTASDAARLRREARTLASLEHAGIVSVHDVGRLRDGRVYLVMSLVRGARLDVHARRLPLTDRLRLFDRICDTVAYAHARGIAHRDLKPANIMVADFGQVRILDWGLAGGAEPGGTDGYRPPEQPAAAFDARVDVYALGAILAELAQGEARPLASIGARATAPDPAARYPTVAELGADVRRFADGQAVRAHRERPIERATRLARTYRTPIALVLTYLAMRVLLLVFAGR